MSTVLQKEIEHLKELVFAERMQVERAISRAMTALLEHDTTMAREVMESDTEIDKMEVRIEEECLRILTLHQPVATDFRFIVAVLKINNDLERMGDYASNIAKRSLTLIDHDRVDLSINLETMADKVKSSVRRSMDAFFKSDEVLARQVCDDDSEIDSMRKYFNETIKNEIHRNPDLTEYLLEFSSLVRHFERLADMATHIAEEVIYLVEGKIVRHAN